MTDREGVFFSEIQPFAEIKEKLAAFSFSYKQRRALLSMGGETDGRICTPRPHSVRANGNFVSRPVLGRQVPLPPATYGKSSTCSLHKYQRNDVRLTFIALCVMYYFQ